MKIQKVIKCGIVGVIRMRCRICGVELNDENWYPSRRKRKDYICNKCLNEITKKKKLYSGGKNHYVIKRDKPPDGRCELCGRQTNKLEYHHFSEIINGKKVAGLWLCHACHNFVERYEQGYLQKYLQLKEEVIKWNTTEI